MKTINIPEKTYFKIGEVAKLLDVEPYVLRYWESEFDLLKPEKTKTGQRVYQRSDIDVLIAIHHLLYEELYTIAGARRQFEKFKSAKVSIAKIPYIELESLVDTSQLAQSNGIDENQWQVEREQLSEEVHQWQGKYERLRDEMQNVHASKQAVELQLQQITADYDRVKAQYIRINAQTSRDEESPNAEWEATREKLQAKINDLTLAVEASERQNEQLRQHHAAILAQREAHKRNLLSAMRQEVENMALYAHA